MEVMVPDSEQIWCVYHTAVFTVGRTGASFKIKSEVNSKFASYYCIEFDS